MSETDPAYSGYFEARGWSRNVSAENYWYYDALLAKLGLKVAGRVLEIGFGDGRFLDWCAVKQIDVTGTEVQLIAVEKAKSLGHNVIFGKIEIDTFSQNDRFNLIAAFDVIEHLTIPELKSMLALTLPNLADDGVYLFRFPNGNSPFAMPLFNADITHRSFLTPVALNEISRSLGLQIHKIVNDRFWPPGFIAKFRRSFAYTLRSAIESLVSFAYFGKRISLDPNIIVVMKKV